MYVPVPTFGTQSFTLGTLPDPSLLHLVCVSAACSHTRPMIGHYVVVCNSHKRQCFFFTADKQTDNYFFESRLITIKIFIVNYEYMLLEL